MDIRIEWGAVFNAWTYFNESDDCYDYVMVAVNGATKEELGRSTYYWREDGIEGPGTPSKEELESYAKWLRKKYPGSTITTW